MIKLTKATMIKKLQENGCKLKENELFNKKYTELKKMLNVPEDKLIKYRKKYKKRTINNKLSKENLQIYTSIKNTIKQGYEGPYCAILELKEMLERAHIPFKMDKVFNGFQILIKYKYKKVSSKGRIFYRPVTLDAVEHDISTGHENDLIEIQGALTKEEYELHNRYDEMYNCLGNLTAYEVLHRWKYCIKHKTKFYKHNEENENENI